MLPTQASLFQLMSARMAWLGQRQVVLSQNLANADTPDYRPRDLKEADFSRLASGVTVPLGLRWPRPIPCTSKALPRSA